MFGSFKLVESGIFKFNLVVAMMIFSITFMVLLSDKMVLHRIYLQFLICNNNLDRIFMLNSTLLFYYLLTYIRYLSSYIEGRYYYYTIIIFGGGGVILKRRHSSNSIKQDLNVTSSQRLLSFGTRHYPIAAVVMAGLFFTSILAARRPTKILFRKYCSELHTVETSTA